VSYLIGTLRVPREVAVSGMIAGSIALSAACCSLLGCRIASDAAQSICWCLFSAAIAFPFFLMVGTRDPALIVLAFVIEMGIGSGAMFGPQRVYFAELFGPRLRYSGFAFARELGSIIAGGPAPLIASSLVAWMAGAPWGVCVYVVAISLVTAFAVWRAEKRPTKMTSAHDDIQAGISMRRFFPRPAVPRKAVTSEMPPHRRNTTPRRPRHPGHQRRRDQRRWSTRDDRTQFAGKGKAGIAQPRPNNSRIDRLRTEHRAAADSHFDDEGQHDQRRIPSTIRRKERDRRREQRTEHIDWAASDAIRQPSKEQQAADQRYAAGNHPRYRPLRAAPATSDQVAHAKNRIKIAQAFSANRAPTTTKNCADCAAPLPKPAA